MARSKMQRQPWGKIYIALVQFESALEVEPHHADDILLFEAMAEIRVAHMAPGGEGDFAFLEVEARVRQLVKVADVIVVQMRQNDIGDRIRVNIELSQALDRTAQEPAFPARRGFRREPGVNEKDTTRPDDDPGKIIHWHGPVVRVAADKMVRAPRIAGRIPDGKNFVFRQLLSHC